MGRPPKVDPAERFLRFIEKDGTSGCWLWTGARLNAGYGCFYLGSRSNGSHRQVKAHRWSYEWFVGPIPAGLQIDHLCRNTSCVNPAHLEAVTPRVNVLRGDTIVAANAAKTHCGRGHSFDEENTLITPQGHRSCRTCSRESMRVIRARRRG